MSADAFVIFILTPAIVIGTIMYAWLSMVYPNYAERPLSQGWEE